MTNDVNKSFLLYYLSSLKERTRVETSSVKTGLDWVIYGIGLARGLTPIRLPFHRTSGHEFPDSKAGAEFGIDASFLSPDKRHLYIFAIKDERLTYKNWSHHGFDRDLGMAVKPDLRDPELQELTDVTVVLAYNKGDDTNGLQAYTNFVSSCSSKIGDKVSLHHERWNIDFLTNEVSTRLMNPNLLPERYFSLFSYICAQFGDFTHGSDQWEQQLIPNWKRFLTEVFSELNAEKAILLLPVSLMILKESGSTNPSSSTGFIDLMEWAALQAWAVAYKSKDELALKAAKNLFTRFYLESLHSFYEEHGDTLSGQHVIDVAANERGGGTDQVASAMRGLWHTARLGILNYGFFEFLSSETPELKLFREQTLRKLANLMVSFINASPSCDRAILDIHHIEIFLIWRTLRQTGRIMDIDHWLNGLERKLFVRRIEKDQLFFVHGGVSMESVWEFAATGRRPPEFFDTSSTLVFMLMILSFCLPEKERNELLATIQTCLVLCRDHTNTPIRDKIPLQLMAWHPPADWLSRILSGNVSSDGECIVFDYFTREPTVDGAPIAAQIETFVREFRAKRVQSFPLEIPESLLLLACLKHGNPMPVEMWLSDTFPLGGQTD